MEKENEEMSYGHVGTGEAATLALLADTARAGRGYYGGEGGGGWGPYASPGANAVRINRNADLHREQSRTTQLAFDQAEESRRFDALCSRINESELRNADRLRDIEREMAANAREAAKCCCEAKLIAAENKAEIIAEIKSSEARNVERALNAANAELTALKTQIACGCCPPQG